MDHEWTAHFSGRKKGLHNELYYIYTIIRNLVVSQEYLEIDGREGRKFEALSKEHKGYSI
jgi:hypothetical protein